MPAVVPGSLPGVVSLVVVDSSVVVVVSTALVVDSTGGSVSGGSVTGVSVDAVVGSLDVGGTGIDGGSARSVSGGLGGAVVLLSKGVSVGVAPSVSGGVCVVDVAASTAACGIVSAGGFVVVGSTDGSSGAGELHSVLATSSCACTRRSSPMASRVASFC